MRGLAPGRRRRPRCGLFFERAAVGGRPPLFSQGSSSITGREAYPVTTDEPMMASMAGRYAAALFDLAKEEGQLPKVEADLRAFRAMLDESADLRRLIRSPVISAEDQSEALDAVLAKAGVSP